MALSTFIAMFLQWLIWLKKTYCHFFKIHFCPPCVDKKQQSLTDILNASMSESKCYFYAYKRIKRQVEKYLQNSGQYVSRK